MSHANFVHLRVHTAYSLLEGALPTADVARLCKTHHMPACAMTDTGNLFGALEFSKTLSSAGIQPIIGCTLALARNEGERRPDQKVLTDSLVVLAKNETGYNNLIKLSSKSYLESGAGDPAHISFDDLVLHGDGLIVLTGGPGGPMGRLILDGQVDAARAWLKNAKEAFGDRLYVEIMRHGLDEERVTEAPFLEFAYEFDVPLVATNQAFFELEDNYEAHDVLLCISDGTYVHEFQPAARDARSSVQVGRGNDGVVRGSARSDREYARYRSALRSDGAVPQPDPADLHAGQGYQRGGAFAQDGGRRANGPAGKACLHRRHG